MIVIETTERERESEKRGLHEMWTYACAYHCLALRLSADAVVANALVTIHLRQLAREAEIDDRATQDKTIVISF